MTDLPDRAAARLAEQSEVAASLVPEPAAGAVRAAPRFPAEAGHPTPLPGQAESAVLSDSLGARLDRLLLSLSEHLNPILVKEARQALKSKTFSVTFSLVLLFAWCVSIVGVALIGPSIYYGNSGPQMFSFYYWILAGALLVIVPFMAFRSLAAEREDGTYEVLCISTLTPSQLISGKLGSSVLQMIVYLSAMAPCLAFTYLLRGIDILTIVYILYLTVLGSLGLSLFGLLLATITRERHWQVVLSVALIAGLLAVFFAACSLTVQALWQNPFFFQEEEFWVANLAILTGYVSYFALLFGLARSQLAFSTANRSTPLRIIMLAQHALFIGWMAYFFHRWTEDEIVAATITILGIHWFVMGAFLVGEPRELSPRVQRSLPHSFLGRALFTWFNPGPGTGWMFALVSLLSGYLFVILTFGWLWLAQGTPGLTLSTDLPTLAAFVGATFLYVAIYLSLGRLLVAGLSRVANINSLVSMMLHFLLVSLGTAIPMTIHLMSPVLREDYSLIEISNPFWTLIELIDGGLNAELPLVFLGLGSVAGLLALLNLPGVVAEVRYTRSHRPRRVEQDDTLIEEQLHPPQLVKSSPWD